MSEHAPDKFNFTIIIYNKMSYYPRPPSFGQAYEANMQDRDTIAQHALRQGFSLEDVNTPRMVFKGETKYTGGPFYMTPSNEIGEYKPYTKRDGGYNKSHKNKHKKSRKTKTRKLIRMAKGNRKPRVRINY